MIDTTELRLELLQIVKDKNGSEVDEIIHNANKLFDWVNYAIVEKDVAEDKPTKPVTLLDEGDERVIENMILNNLICFYKLYGSMDSSVKVGNRLEYAVIPDHWNDNKKKFYKLLIDTINTRFIGNSGIEPVVKISSVLLDKSLEDPVDKSLEDPNLKNLHYPNTRKMQ